MTSDPGFGMVGHLDEIRDYLDEIERLREAATYARDVLARVRAFGDDIGPVSKAELGTAYNKLKTVLS